MRSSAWPNGSTTCSGVRPARRHLGAGGRLRTSSEQALNEDVLDPRRRAGEPQPRLAYVVKRFPRYSETFVVNEILAHESAGCVVEIFSLRSPNDTHFQDTLARVRAPVRYVPWRRIRADEFWSASRDAFAACASFESLLRTEPPADSLDVYQALVLARWLRHGQVTHVHAHFAAQPATVTRLAASLTGIPWSFTAHANDIFHADV